MFSFNSGHRLPTLRQAHRWWQNDRKGRMLLEFLSSLDKITPSIDDTAATELLNSSSVVPERINLDHAPEDRFMDQGNDLLLDVDFTMSRVNEQLPSSQGLPPLFIKDFCLGKTFRKNYRDADFSNALTGLDYLSDLECTRRTAMREAAQRLGITKDNWRDVLRKDKDVLSWVEMSQKFELVVEGMYAEIYISLRLWTMVNELSCEPFYKPNVVAMLNTLFPPSIRELPNEKVTVESLHKYRSSLYRYLVAVAVNGSQVLNSYVAKLSHPSSNHSWANTFARLEQYIEMANSMIDQANYVHGIDFFRENRSEHSSKTSDAPSFFTFSDRTTTSTTADTSFSRFSDGSTPPKKPSDHGSIKSFFSRRRGSTPKDSQATMATFEQPETPWSDKASVNSEATVILRKKSSMASIARSIIPPGLSKRLQKQSATPNIRGSNVSLDSENAVEPRRQLFSRNIAQSTASIKSENTLRPRKSSTSTIVRPITPMGSENALGSQTQSSKQSMTSQVDPKEPEDGLWMKKRSTSAMPRSIAPLGSKNALGLRVRASTPDFPKPNPCLGSEALPLRTQTSTPNMAKPAISKDRQHPSKLPGRITTPKRSKLISPQDFDQLRSKERPSVPKSSTPKASEKTFGSLGKASTWSTPTPKDRSQTSRLPRKACMWDTTPTTPMGQGLKGKVSTLNQVNQMSRSPDCSVQSHKKISMPTTSPIPNMASARSTVASRQRAEGLTPSAKQLTACKISEKPLQLKLKRSMPNITREIFHDSRYAIKRPTQSTLELTTPLSDKDTQNIYDSNPTNPPLEASAEPAALKLSEPEQKPHEAVSSGQPTTPFEKSDTLTNNSTLDNGRLDRPKPTLMSKKTILPSDNLDFLQRPYEGPYGEPSDHTYLRPLVKKKSSFSSLFLRKKSSSSTICDNSNEKSSSKISLDHAKSREFEPSPKSPTELDEFDSPSLRKQFSFGYLGQKGERLTVRQGPKIHQTEPLDTSTPKPETTRTVRLKLAELNARLEAQKAAKLEREKLKRREVERKKALKAKKIKQEKLRKEREKLRRMEKKTRLLNSESVFVRTGEDYERFVFQSPEMMMSLQGKKKRSGTSFKPKKIIKASKFRVSPRKIVRTQRAANTLTNTPDIIVSLPAFLRMSSNFKEKDIDELQSQEYTRKWFLEEARASRYGLEKPVGRPFLERPRQAPKTPLAVLTPKVPFFSKPKTPIIPSPGSASSPIVPYEQPRATPKIPQRPTLVKEHSIFPEREILPQSPKPRYTWVDTTKYKDF
ncbi:hypothetical protein B7494_g4913 [Chlorociboria aeruginascens]|nr:hypothetical protein B7494_g4913 [Chlorociboria aeruginascens]